ncbi:CCT domain [Sesbania bispinosa]|nr:CCT domain [Sesbania bispinosa]
MSGSPNPKHQDAEAPQVHRTCDNCGDSTPLLYCKADSAKLCFSCDRVVHSTNQLFSKHTRSQLCDACGDAPATILCCDENSVLCQNCDWESTNNDLSVHQRRPLEGFSGCPSVTQLLTIVGLSEKTLLSNEGSSEIEEGLSDLVVWESRSVFGLDDLIASTDSSHNYHAMPVPPLHKKHKAACGRQKEEIVRQLRELAKSEPGLIYGNADAEQHMQSGNLSTSYERDIEAHIFPSCEAGTGVFWWQRESSDPANQVVPSDTSLRTYSEQIPANDRIVSENHANDNDEGKPSNSFNAETLSTTPRATPYELTSQERDSALLRYKEKKKTRRYDKHIRYESRKVRAESRIRVKGRFAKDETL